MSDLQVLITNGDLNTRSGTTMYVHDLALKLQERHCTPIVYSPKLGHVAKELAKRGVTTVDNLQCFAEPPDVIHGHHSLELMTALLRFPRTPAIFVCHDFTAWHDTPPIFPRLRRYVAVDEACLDRLCHQHGVPRDRARLLLNAVDLDRFEQRSALPATPARALLFSNYLNNWQMDAIRQACAAASIDLDTAGRKLSGFCDRPEAKLRNYDLVFAKGRCALEALAVGAAVIVCDAPGVGPLVTARDLERLRRASFGRRLMLDPIEARVIADRIARYDPIDAAEVSKRIRATAGLNLLVEQLLQVYQEVIAEENQSGEQTELEYLAAAEFLHWWSMKRDELVKTSAKQYTLVGRLTRYGGSVARRVPTPLRRILARMWRPSSSTRAAAWLTPDRSGQTV